MGILGGQKIRSPGNVMNCPENQSNNFDLPHPGGPGGLVCSKCQKSGKFQLPRRSIIFFPSGNFRGSKKQKSGKCHELPRKVVETNVTPTPPHPTGVGSFMGKHFKCLRHFHELSRKSIFFVSPRLLGPTTPVAPPVMPLQVL